MGLEMTRVFAAPIDQVWKAWTDPSIFCNWYGPMPDPCDVQALDVRVGGAYKVLMGGHEDKGIYHAVRAPNHLKMGAANGSAWMDMQFLAADGETSMVLTMGDIPDEYVEQTRGAWNMAFAKLDKLLE